MGNRNLVTTAKNTTIDGSTFQSSLMNERNITITAQMDANYQENRDYLYAAFAPKSTGTLFYHEGDIHRKIDYWVEDIEIAEAGVVREIRTSLICPDPVFRETNEVAVPMSEWIGLFEWDHEFPEDGEEFERRQQEYIKNIVNDGTAGSIGVTIEIDAEGDVKNPIVRRLEDDEFIRANVTLRYGDRLVITTGVGNKKVMLTSGGTTKNVNSSLDEDGDFIQLRQGPNTFAYDAETGRDSMNVTVRYARGFLGV